METQIETKRRPCGGPGRYSMCSREAKVASLLDDGACSRTFPIQGGLLIPWWAAQRAYETYAKRYGRSQSLERLAERGGFGLNEWGVLFAGRDPSRDWGSERDRMTAAALETTIGGAR